MLLLAVYRFFFARDFFFNPFSAEIGVRFPPFSRYQGRDV
jgi:hypothetical protein